MRPREDPDSRNTFFRCQDLTPTISNAELICAHERKLLEYSRRRRGILNEWARKFEAAVKDAIAGRRYSTRGEGDITPSN